VAHSETTSDAPDFGPLAARYDELRPLDENSAELFEVLVREGELLAGRVVDVGCGTGRVAAALATRGGRVWGVDPSPEMLAVARDNVPRGVGLKRGAAEQLPFKDGWFDRAVMHLVVHLVDRPLAFAEIRRVLAPGGRLTIATFDPTHFQGYWLNDFFPSLEAIDRARFPTGDQLVAELETAEFASPRLTALHQDASLDRESALVKIRGRHISTLHLIADDEYRTGIARAERDLPARIDYTLDWLIAVAAR
jgi:SAM-dependent methyltransferase